MAKVVIEKSWENLLKDEFDKEYFVNLSNVIRDRYISTVVYPKPVNIFKAFNMTPVDTVKVVILGQDPYHGKDQAIGLSFAVNANTPIPPSLKNIFKEVEDDTGVKPTYNGDLTRWAKQGVLLLNSVLTVDAGKPASHKGLGWETFTSEVIKKLSDTQKNIVYLLWGKYAQDKGSIIDTGNNLVLASAHPSPYSADKFFGNHHFSKTNHYLLQHNKKPINWQ